MKNTLLAAGICFIVVAFAAALYFTNGNTLFASSDAAASAAAAKVPVIVLGKGNAISDAPKVNYRITTQKQLNRVWTIAYGSSTPPTVNFNNNDVLAVFDGSHSTTGYSILILNVADGSGARVVTINHVSPTSGCSTIAQTTMPFEFVLVPATTLSMSHKDKTSTSCNS